MGTATVFWGVTFILHLLGAGIISQFYDTGVASAQECPCEDPKYCERIKDTTRKEIFVFSLNAKNDDWRFYNWTKVTTVVMVGYLDMKLVCQAHKYGARAITIGSVSTDILTNATAKTSWISKQLQLVKDYYLDGVNFDYEDAILQTQPGLRNGYRDLVARTTAAFKSYDPSLMVSVDVAWSPNCIDQRCYDYYGLAEASDFLFVMAYDEQSQIFGTCKAGPNSDYEKTYQGLDRFLEMTIPPDKLVLGVPWYGYYYPCLSLKQENECLIKEVPFRGVNCSDAAGRQLNYYSIIKMLKNSTTGRLWDIPALSPYFNYKMLYVKYEKNQPDSLTASEENSFENVHDGRRPDAFIYYKRTHEPWAQDPTSGILHQIRYDDPQSLNYKYTKAIDLDLRGVGMWNAECVDYLSTDRDDILAVKQMWGALPDYKKTAVVS